MTKMKRLCCHTVEWKFEKVITKSLMASFFGTLCIYKTSY